MLTLLPVVALGAIEPPTPKVEYPHPLITEILYAVPTGAGGDANGDGVRETNGDEFVELVNPHDKAIDLRGYVLSGKTPDDPRRKFTTLRFVFPPVVLKPGESVVVFNGHRASWKGPVGDTTRAAGANEHFAGARVFSMRVESSRLGWSNQGDLVLLTSPRGEKVQCITWGEIGAPEGVKLVEEAPRADKASVMRRTVDGELEPHPPMDGKRFSPGLFPIDKERTGAGTETGDDGGKRGMKGSPGGGKR